MKNSNKLLILLIALVLTIPILGTISLKTAIRENRYVVKNMFGVEEAAFVSLKPFKVVKLNSDIKNPLLCNIKSGNKHEYKFVNYNTKENGKDMPDNFSINVVGDTLFISYQAKDADQHLLELDLMVPDGVSVVAESARIGVNTINGDSPKNLLMDLSKNAELHISTGYNRDENIIHPEQEKLAVSNYTIKSVDAEVNVSASIHISNLKMEIINSKVSIGPNVIIDSVSGSMSPETIINAPYKFVKNLQ